MQINTIPQPKLNFKAIFIFLFFACAMLANTSSFAQTHIPDANFAAAIRQQCPTCIDGNDDLTAAAGNLTSLNVSTKNISSLVGIEGFTSLDTLNCYSNNLTSLPNSIVLLNNLLFLNCRSNQLVNLPVLPINLINLDCSYNQIFSLSTLSNNLIKLDCSSNSITVLPNLPSSLKHLVCSSNRLTYLPTLPSNLQYLVCPSNRLTYLPTLPSNLQYLTCGFNRLNYLPTLPNNLNSLDCPYNFLTSLPRLSNTLEVLVCCRNQITNLPDLPNSLGFLNCGGNPIAYLPVLPNRLLYLTCYENQFTYLPALPNSLITLTCSDERLTSLPNIPPALTQLDARNNPNLHCIGILPNTLTTLNLTNTAITCLPNIPTGITTTLPVCTAANNTNNCKIAPIVSGTVYYDLDGNGVQDIGERGIANTMVKDNVRGSGRFLAVTDSLGRYVGAAEYNKLTFMGCDSVGSAFTTTPWLHSISTNIDEYQTFPNKNFGYRALRVDDSIQVHIHTSVLVPEDTSICMVVYRNRGTTTLNGTVDVALSDTLEYVSATQQRTARPNRRFTINTQTYSYMNLQPFQQQSVAIKVRTPTAAVIGSVIHNRVVANGARTSGGGGSTDEDSEVKTIRGSHDPNNKECTQTALTPAEVLQGKPIEYTINFENTGTWHAKHIVIEDTLSAYLDYHTLQTLATSHPRFRVRMEFDTLKASHKVVVKWIFPNIGLKYKSLSSSEAQGFVRFSIQAKPTAPLGTVIENTGYIYFDVNSAVVTNSVSLNVAHPLPVEWLSMNAALTANKTVNIDWATASERNNSHFTIERSTDGGVLFAAIGSVKAKNTVTGASYAWQDRAITHGIYYYRILQTDVDGAKSYSNTMSVVVSAAISPLLAQPNPTRTKTMLSWQEPLEKAGNLTVTNALGQVVLQVVVPANTTFYELSLESLPQGSYTVRLDCEGKGLLARVVRY